MNWDAITGIAEILGTLAVLITLFYLARQVRQNTEEIRSANYHRVTNSFNEINLAVAENPNLARLFRIGNEEYEKLSDDEKYQYGFFYAFRFPSFRRHKFSEPARHLRYDALGI